ncbi:hypothetical protein [Henriciella aquimarina]|uniref:hypothetical protein n=1 Tax=Henriciella aquimarina TaxID=545261 RepID=UPI000A01D5A4|nr:hypothetical protein [Henriciella aquimarina]
MRIVDRETFLNLPAGTVFMKFPDQPEDGSYFALDGDGEVQIKWRTSSGVDFVCQNLVPFPEGWHDDGDVSANQIAMLRGEEGKPADYDCAGRDGLFDQDQLFLVWDTDSHQKLIDLLQRALDMQLTESEPAAP